MKKFFLFFVVLFFGFGSVSSLAAGIPIVPGQTLFLRAEQAYGTRAVVAFAGAAARTNPLLTALLAIYAANAALKVDMPDLELDMDDGKTMRFPMSQNGRSKIDALAPATPVAVIPTNTFAVTFNCASPAPIAYGASPAEACDAFLPKLQACDYASQGYDRGITLVSSSNNQCDFAFQSGYHQYIAVANGGTSCLPGYVLSGSECQYQWPAPLTRNHISDNYVDSIDDIDSNGRDPQSYFTFSGYDQFGPFTAEIMPYTTSGEPGAIRLRFQNDTPSGSDVITDYVEFDYRGNPISGHRITTPNARLNPAPTPVPGGPPVTTLPPVVTPTNPGGSEVNFPNDYAKDSSVQATNSKLQEIKAKMDAESEKMDALVVNPNIPQPSLDAVPTGADSFSFIKDHLNIATPNFSHTSQCPVSSFSWNDRVYVVDQHCLLISNHWSIFSAAMFAVWTVLSLFIVLRA